MISLGESLIVGGAILGACALIARRVWRTVRRPTETGCSRCQSCPGATGATPPITAPPLIAAAGNEAPFEPRVAPFVPLENLRHVEKTDR